MLVTVGAVIGLAAAAASSRVLESFLYQPVVKPRVAPRVARHPPDKA